MGADPVAVVKGKRPPPTFLKKPVDIEEIHHSLVEGVACHRWKAKIDF